MLGRWNHSITIWILIILILFYPFTSIADKPALYENRVSGFHSLIIYYGWLNTSNLLALAPSMVVVAGSERILPGGADQDVINSLLS
ncbi:MAG: hypothetical protein GSR74_00850, partial [Desulfurococcales archaeon]|nr:hypothetical protein [Desulfurococcales archaeon]